MEHTIDSRTAPTGYHDEAPWLYFTVTECRVLYNSATVNAFIGGGLNAAF